MNALGDHLLSSQSSSGARATVSDPAAALLTDQLIAAASERASLVERVARKSSPVVAVTLPMSTEALVMLVAAIVADHTICFLDPAAPDERRRAISEGLRPDVVVDSDGVRASDEASSEASEHDEAREPGYVALSSGSTGGAPKAVLTSWSTVAAFVRDGAEALELDETSVFAEISHIAYDMSMTNLLVALASGAAVHVSSALGDRLRPLRFVDRVRATHVRMAPRFIDLAVAERRQTGPGTLRVWGSGGDRLFAVQAEQVHGLGVPLVINTYGTSETAGFASAARISRGGTIPTVHGSVSIGVGRVGAWHAEVIAHEGGDMLAIRTPHQGAGYLFGEAGSYPRWVGDDVVVTGDIGARVANQLFCLGRSGRRVKRSAVFVDLDEIDATIRSKHGFASFTIATQDGTLATVVESGSVDVDEMRRALTSLLRPDMLPERLIPVGQLPRLGNGKIDHVAVQVLIENG
jgi:acyl-coenzyme A synthetase/AMP-(fatty) acid ligase